MPAPGLPVNISKRKTSVRSRVQCAAKCAGCRHLPFLAMTHADPPMSRVNREGRTSVLLFCRSRLSRHGSTGCDSGTAWKQGYAPWEGPPGPPPRPAAATPLRTALCVTPAGGSVTASTDAAKFVNASQHDICASAYLASWNLCHVVNSAGRNRLEPHTAVQLPQVRWSQRR